jgi:hypothetical protein
MGISLYFTKLHNLIVGESTSCSGTDNVLAYELKLQMTGGWAEILSNCM